MGNRVTIKKGLQKSSAPNMFVKTNADNEQEYISLAALTALVGGGGGGSSSPDVLIDCGTITAPSDNVLIDCGTII